MAIEQKKVEQRTEPERHILGRPVIYQVGTWGIGYLPKRLSYWFARRIADISYLFYKKARLNVKNKLRELSGYLRIALKDILTSGITLWRYKIAHSSWFMAHSSCYEL